MEYHQNDGEEKTQQTTKEVHSGGFDLIEKQGEKEKERKAAEDARMEAESALNAVLDKKREAESARDKALAEASQAESHWAKRKPEIEGLIKDMERILEMKTKAVKAAENKKEGDAN